MNLPRMAEVNRHGNRQRTGRQPSRSRAGSPAPEPAARRRALLTLSPAECFELLEPGGIGRVGFTSADEIIMLPVNFAVMRKTIIFRTAPDTLLALYGNAQVSFEADRIDEELHEGWSVLVLGRAHKVTEEREVRHLQDWTHLQPWAAGARDVYVRIAPIRISGRRICQSRASPPVPGAEP
jgi:nitroimidazol reductase NimA-like FMN-containing flavoprotein (pyridoxamine 5'-phosphate oxidase superfamily)